MKVDARLVQLFVAVAEELSFTKAAEKLYLAQPWLSSQIRKLESQLGYDLFVRNSRHVELTSNGESLLQHGRAITKSLEAFGLAAMALQQDRRQVLRIGAPPYSYRFPVRVRLMDAYARQNPQVSIDSEIAWSPLLTQLVKEGKLDMAFVMGMPEDELIQRQTVHEAEIKVYCRASDELGERESVRWEDLAGREVLGFSRVLNPGLFDQVLEPAQQAGASVTEYRELVDDSWLDQILSRGAVGISFFGRLPSHVSEEIRIVDLASPVRVGLQLIRRVGHEQPAVAKFWELVGNETHGESRAQ